MDQPDCECGHVADEHEAWPVGSACTVETDEDGPCPCDAYDPA